MQKEEGKEWQTLSRLTGVSILDGVFLTRAFRTACLCLCALPYKQQDKEVGSIETDKAISDYHYYCLFQSSLVLSYARCGCFFFTAFRQSDNATSHI